MKEMYYSSNTFKATQGLTLFLVGMFLMVGTASAQYSYDYGGGDYGYTYSDYTYDYGGGDYGYAYDDYTYDYGGGDYGYTYDDYTYDYGGGDYGYTYDDYTYDYGGGDYGYTYSDYTYDYGGGDYGYAYDDYGYNYGGGDYGYAHDDYTYDYGGGDYGYAYDDYGYNYGGGDYGYNYDYGYTYDYGDYVAYDYGYTYDYGYSYPYNDYGYGGGYGYPIPPYNYTYACTTCGGSNPPPQPSCDAFGASDTSVEEGDEVILEWRTTDADDVDINNGIGDVANDGSRVVTVHDDITYTLTARSGGYTDTCQVTIHVEEEDEDDPVRCDAFTVSDSRVDEGDFVTLEWRTTNAESVFINNGVGNVGDDGSHTLRVFDDTTYTLTARNDDDVDTCQVTVRVDEEDDDNDDDDDQVRCDAFTVSDDRVDEGDFVTLRWRTTGADDVRIDNGIGDVSDDGSERVRVWEDTTFRLTARDNGDTDTCRVTVRVDEDDDDDRDAPRCRLTISDTHIYEGQEVTLRWDNDRTDRAVLEDNHGREFFDTRHDRDVDEDSDSIQVRPTRDTEYTLTVYNGNVRRTCTVEVEEGPGATTTRYQERFINLALVPYTGFEAGPVLTFIFYAAVVLWGMVIAYVLVMRKRIQTAGDTKNNSVTTATMELDAPASTPAETSVPANLPVGESASPDTRALEAHAHAQYALFSSDALNYVAGLEATHEARVAKLDDVIARAKAKFPKEGDWIVLNKERVMEVLG